MASSRAKVLRSTRARWKPMPAAIVAKRLMSSTGPTRSARSGRWPSIWQHWRPKLDRKTRQNAATATAQMADASVSRHQSSGAHYRADAASPWRSARALNLQRSDSGGPMLGDAGQRYSRRAAIPGRGQIPEGDDAHEAFLVVEHRQTPDLLRGHVLGKIIDVIVLEAVFHLSAHHVADRGFRTEPMGDTSHGDIPVRDHSHQTIVVADRQHADVALFHLGRSFAQRLARARETDISCHDFTRLHPVLLFLRDASSYPTARWQGQFRSH